jgi:hypothetical protein
MCEYTIYRHSCGHADIQYGFLCALSSCNAFILRLHFDAPEVFRLERIDKDDFKNPVDVPELCPECLSTEGFS